MKSAQDTLYLRTGGERIFLSHYAHRTWRSNQRGTWHLFGHSHGRLLPYGRSFDVGLNANGYWPISLDQVRMRMQTLPIVSADHTVHTTHTISQ